MSILLFANNIQTTLASNITSVQTSITLVSAAGLPNPSSGQYFVMTFTNGATNEVVWVTNVTGSVITCIRAQEGTSAQTFAAGSYASCFPTAGTMRDLVQIDQLQNGAYTFTNGAGTANALTATIASNLTVVPNGFQFILNASNANTNAATLNLTLNPTISGASPVSTGALPILQNGTFPLTGGEITGANYLCLFTYNANYNSGGGAFVLENPYNPVTGVVGITQVQDQYFTYASSGGSTDALTVSLPAGLSALTDGAVVTFRNAISSNTTTTPTLDVTYGSTDTGATVIKKYNNLPVSIGDTGGVGYICQLVYSSSNSAWMLLNPAPGAASGVTSLVVGNSGIGFSGYSGISGYTGTVTAYNKGVVTVNGSNGTNGAVIVSTSSIGAVDLTSAQNIGGLKTYTTGLVSTAYNFTYTGSSATDTSMYYSAGAQATVMTCQGISTFLILDHTGSISISGSGAQKASGTTWTNPSDARLKTNIANYTKSLAELIQINPKTWTFNGLGGSKLGTYGLGVIADEISSVLPDTVTTYSAKLNPTDTENTNIKQFDASEVTWLLVNSVKELNLKVAQLETTINIQAAYIAALQAKV
jgi:hypothetical protein